MNDSHPITDPVVRFIADQAPEVQIAMVRHAAHTQNVKALRQHREAGLFDLHPGFNRDQDRFKSELTFAVNEHPAIAALTCAVHARTTRRCTEDTVTGEPLDGTSYYPMSIERDPEFRVFIREVADTFASQHETRMAECTADKFPNQTVNKWQHDSDPPEPEEEARQFMAHRFMITMGVLLAAAGSLDDAPLARHLCELMGGSEKLFKGSQAEFDFSVSGRFYEPDDVIVDTMHHPVVGALSFASADVLDVFLEHGWDPARTLNTRRTSKEQPTAGRSAFQPCAVDEFHSLMKVLTDEGIDVMPGLMAKILPAFASFGRKFPHPAAKEIQAWSFHLLEQDESPLNMIRIALQAGVYDIDPTASFLHAARRGSRDVLDALHDRVDWSTFTPASSPVREILTNEHWDQHGDEIAPIALDVMRWAIEHGRADMVRDAEITPLATSFDCWVPINECARKHLTAGVVMCLEQGANPNEDDSNDDTALSVAEANGYDDIINVARSIEARRAAESAMHEMGMGLCEGADTGVPNLLVGTAQAASRPRP